MNESPVTSVTLEDVIAVANDTGDYLKFSLSNQVVYIETHLCKSIIFETTSVFGLNPINKI